MIFRLASADSPSQGKLSEGPSASLHLARYIIAGYLINTINTVRPKPSRGDLAER